MAKNKNKPTKEVQEIEKSEEVLTVVDTKKAKKEDKSKASKSSKAETSKKSKQTKKQKNDKPKRNFGKEVVSELKKVTWPTFKKTCQQTGTVLAVVAVFMLATLGIDTLVSWILKLITKI